MKVIYNNTVYISPCKGSDWITPSHVCYLTSKFGFNGQHSTKFCQQFIFDTLSQRLNVFVYKREITVTATNADRWACSGDSPVVRISSDFSEMVKQSITSLN